MFQRLPILESKWKCVTMDFMMGLPETPRGNKSIWVIVDRLTESSYFSSIWSNLSAKCLALANV